MPAQVGPVRGGLPDVPADVVPIRVHLLVEPPLHLLHELEERRLLLLGGLEPGRRQAPCDDQGMPGAHREKISGKQLGQSDIQQSFQIRIYHVQSTGRAYLRSNTPSERCRYSSTR